MPQEGAFVATLYAPIMFPPAPVLVFTQDKHTSKALFSRVVHSYRGCCYARSKTNVMFHSNGALFNQ